MLSTSRNPYQIEGQEPTLRNSVFVFMDILGYSEMIRIAEESGTQQNILRKLHQSLASGRAWLEDKDVSAQIKALSDKDIFSLKAFTDNIVIGWPILDDAESEFGSAVLKLACFQLQMVEAGFFIRGALSIGQAYIDEVTVFGNALSEAYIGESSMARDPRIILTPSVVLAVKKHLGYYGNPRHAPHVQAILSDSDGQWFLNYLDCVLIAEDEQGPFYDDIIKHKKAVEEKLREFREKPTIWSKYAWVASYHNYFCELHSSDFSEEYKINIELFRASPTLIIE